MGRRGLSFLAVAALLAVVDAVLPGILDVYYLHVVNVALVNMLLALGLNYIVGFGGQISLAQAAFFGIGAYTYAVATLHHLPLGAAVGLSLLFAVAGGLVIGWPSLKLRGHYLALATLGFGIIVNEFLVNLSGVTGGANGLMNIPPLAAGSVVLGNDAAMFRFMLVVAALAVAASAAFSRTPLGLKVRAFRDDETAAEAAGVNVRGIKLLLFLASALYAGLAGVFYAALIGYVSPDVFAWDTTFTYLVMIVVGGLGSTAGAVAGAVLLTLVPEWLRFLQNSYLAVFGVVVIVVMAFFPGGLAHAGGGVPGWVRARGLVRAFGRRPAKSVAEDEAS
ncbi:MAG: branched-chain amino acid ABC transporter permease [Actinomycetia bacterium]|nr:branched-chain amino acid ABC transporter permease [Actinomycetes bacterium]